MGMTEQIRMSANAYFFFLRSIPCAEKLLDSKHTVNGANAAQEYIAAREIWCAEQWAEMDLDGLILTQQIQQLIYPIIRCRGLLRWEHDGIWECFVRGAVGFVWVMQDGASVTLAQKSGGFASRRLHEQLKEIPRGKLTALRIMDRQTASAVLDGFAPDEDGFGAQMEQMLTLLYREVSDA